MIRNKKSSISIRDVIFRAHEFLQKGWKMKSSPAVDEEGVVGLGQQL